MILSEGSRWEGYDVKEYGEADAFGHRKKMSGEDLSEEIQKRPARKLSSATLLTISGVGDPDFVDKLVASTFAGMAIDCIEQGQLG